MSFTVDFKFIFKRNLVVLIVSTVEQCVLLFKEFAHFTDIMISGIIFSWISSLLFNALVFGMTFARTFRLALSSRRYGSPDSLTNMLLRDGKKLNILYRTWYNQVTFLSGIAYYS